MILQGSNLDFRYRNGEFILRGVTITVTSGEVVGLLGPSGRGKSTLAKILAGYLRPAKGQLSIDGKAIPGKGYHPVQLIFQHPEKAVNPRWKMSRTITEGYKPDMELMKILDIQENWLNRYPNELSGGELQRFCVLRALSDKTRFLICDEITTMLDALTQARIWNFLLRYARERQIGVLLITHSWVLADKTCTRIISWD
ncbi:MAG: ATP-binding cassette domain-containing protein [Treponema sp.]|nr:ATP-binding cassette domain-containing protein [Treponema sp.]